MVEHVFFVCVFQCMRSVQLQYCHAFVLCVISCIHERVSCTLVRFSEHFQCIYNIKREKKTRSALIHLQHIQSQYKVQFRYYLPKPYNCKQSETLSFILHFTIIYTVFVPHFSISIVHIPNSI